MQITPLAPRSRKRIPIAYSALSAGDALEITDDYSLLDINALVTKDREGFIAFVVTGDSMVDEILPGYVVFVDSWVEPQNGDIVAAFVNGLHCIKRFERKATRLRLVSNNSNYQPREIKPTDSLRIVGVVKAHLALY